MSDVTKPTPLPEQPHDAAGRGLSDALAISFRLLRVLFVLLLIAFLLSGVFTVSANEVAVRTSFGRITGGEGGVLTPEGGPYFRWPRPIGEVYKIPTASREVSVRQAFAFQTRDESEPLGTAFPINAPPDPAYGFLITGDKNIVYARYVVTYRVRPEEAIAFVRNAAGPDNPLDDAGLDDEPDLLFERAERLIRFAVQKAAVADTACRSIDDFRASRTGDEGGGGGDMIQTMAQATLDELSLGIEIQSVNRPEYTVPPAVRPAFEALNVALQGRSNLVEQGRAERRAALTAAAGEAAPALLAAIDAYEAADARVRAAEDDAATQSAEQDRQRAREAVDALLVGTEVSAAVTPLAESLPEGDPFRARLLEEVEVDPNAVVSGQAFATVARASTEGSSLARQAESLRDRVDALLPDYRADPERLRYRLTLAALQFVMTREDADVEVVRDVERLVVPIPPDPERRRLDQQRGIQGARRQQPPQQ